MNCWIEQPDGTKTLDKEAFWKTMREIREKVESTADKWRTGNLEGVPSPCEPSERASNE